MEGITTSLSFYSDPSFLGTPTESHPDIRDLQMVSETHKQAMAISFGLNYFFIIY